MGDPISIVEFKISREAVKDVKCLAGFDRGCSLTKLVYVPKEEKDILDCPTYTFHCALFENARFTEALDWMKEHAWISEGAQFQATGAGGVFYKELIEEKLGVNLIFIEELSSQICGANFLVKEIDGEDLFYPDILPEKEIKFEHSKMMEKMINDRKKQMEEAEASQKGSNGAYIFGFMGSASGICLINEEGKGRMLGGGGIGGKTFLGLGRCLLGTGKYSEICDLAEKGSQQNVDTEVWEVLTDDPDSPYGRFPKDMPIFPFGKSADRDQGLETMKREDIAASLIGMTALTAIQSCVSQCGVVKVNKVYIGGNMMQHEAFRKKCSLFLQFFKGMKLEMKFLKTGHTAAFGAMLATPGEEMNAMVV